MGFESAVFRNLQKHRKTAIKFAKVTTLVGPSQAGKTGLIRGLSLICLNTWDKAFLRHGKSTVIASLKVDGKKITRKKGKGVNQYLLDGKVLKRDITGKEVPDEIANLLNVGPENFQMQLDPHFWFMDTPGQVSKNLNKIINLDIIDSTLASAASEVRSAKAEVEVSQNRFHLAKAKYKDIAWFPEFEKDFKRLEELDAETGAISHRIASIRFCIENVRSLDIKVGRASEAMLDAKKLLAFARDSLKLSKQSKSLGKLVENLKNVSKTIKAGAPDLSELDFLRKKGDQIAEDRRNLEIIIDDLKELEERKCKLEQMIHEASAKVKKVKVCPICGQKASSAPICTSGISPQSRVPKKATSGTPPWGGI